MDNTKRSFDLTSFINQQSKMIAKNEQAWEDSRLSFQSSTFLQDYSQKEIENIINNGDISSQQKLSLNYFYKNGFYKQILLYYATLLKYIDVPDTDKQRAMGHAKFEMTAHYTHADMSGMDKIANDISDLIFIVQQIVQQKTIFQNFTQFLIFDKKQKIPKPL